MRAVITVIGKDKVGIIARVSRELAELGVNILDISQTIMQDLFTMTMLVDVSGCTRPFGELAGIFSAVGQELGLDIRIQHEDLFHSMHRI